MKNVNKITNQDRRAEAALQDEANKPAPLYNKTDGNFQRQYQGPQEGNAKDTVESPEASSSSSEEEKDII